MSKAKVYHKINPDFMPEHNPKRDDYKLVAEVDANDLDKVYARTQNIDSSWTKNSIVSTNLPQCRSTSVGDMIEVNGQLHMVDMIGFKNVQWK